VLVVCEHSATHYSGGRYHSWIMAEAIAAGNAEVVIWTTERPLLVRDFEDYPGHDRITLYVDPDFSTRPPGGFNAIILSQHMGLDWAPYLAAVSAARSLNAPLVCLDFEATKWFNAENAQKRTVLRTAAFWATGRYADVILSSTQYGSERAREYYRPFRPSLAFRYCPPSINSIAADSVAANRVNQIICIARLNTVSRHKGITALLNVFSDQIAGYDFVIIGSMPEETEIQLHKAAEVHGVNLMVKSGLTDREKFKEIKKSRLMVFLSTFEGFGYPPVEALYCGTPCIVNPLPVLKEISGNALIYLNGAAQDLPLVVKKALERTEPLIPPNDHHRISRNVSFESYVERLDQILNDLEAPDHRPVVARARVAADIGAFMLVGYLSKWIYRRFRRKAHVAR